MHALSASAANAVLNSDSVALCQSLSFISSSLKSMIRSGLATASSLFHAFHLLTAYYRTRQMFICMQRYTINAIWHQSELEYFQRF